MSSAGGTGTRRQGPEEFARRYRAELGDPGPHEAHERLETMAAHDRLTLLKPPDVWGRPGSGPGRPDPRLDAAACRCPAAVVGRSLRLSGR